MRWFIFPLVLFVAGCSSKGPEERQGPGGEWSLHLTSARFGTMHLSNGVFPEGLSIVLSEAALGCEEVGQLESNDLRLVVEVLHPSIGECQIVESAFDEETGCVASARIVRSLQGGKVGDVRSIEGTGSVVLREIGGDFVRGELTIAVPKMQGVHCESMAAIPTDGSEDIEWETTCTCTEMNGSTWTCSEPAKETDCCLADATVVEVTTTFEASRCGELCGCLTLVDACPCRAECHAAPSDCEQACGKAADDCSSCTPGVDCEAFADRCVSSCESGFSEPVAMALLSCFETSASCDELALCMGESCPIPDARPCEVICARAQECKGTPRACTEDEIQDCEGDLEGLDLDAVAACVSVTPCDELDSCMEE